MFNPLIEKIIQSAEVPENGSVVEIGNQTWINGGKKVSSENFYKSIGWKSYRSYDISPEWNSIAHDFNEGVVKGETADLVVNNGTSEHIYNQGNVFASCHGLCRAGGMMVHVLPSIGWINHGFFNYQPIFFRDLAAANGYEILGLYFGTRDGRIDRIDIAGIDPYHHPKAWKEEVTPIEKAIQGFGGRANIFIVAILRKICDGAFVAPIQGKYAEIKPAAVQSGIPLILPDNIEVFADPFPHVVLHPALPEDLYEKLALGWPEYSLISEGKTDDPTFGNVLHQLSAKDVVGNGKIESIWRQFFIRHVSQEWLQRIFAVFGDHIGDMMRKMPEKFTAGVRGTGNFDIEMDCQFAINTPTLRPSRVRGPHIDNPKELVAGLLYFGEPGDKAGGDLTLYRWKTEASLTGKAEALDEHVEAVATVRYSPNTAIFFVNGPNALHGVSERQKTILPRRYVNIIVETNKPLFDMPPIVASDQSGLREVHRR